MSELSDFLATLAGERPERHPFCPMGHWNARACRKLLPTECFDGNLYATPEGSFSPEPRTEQSRQTAVNYGRFMQLSSLGTGKGGCLPFGHGGPGEIVGQVERRIDDDTFLLRYEGGSTRLLRYNPYAVHYGHSMPLEGPADLERLELPDPDNPARWQDIAADSAAFEAAGIMPAGKIMGFFSGIHNSFLDFQKLMLAFFDEPEFVQALTRRLAEWSLRCVEQMLTRGVRLIEVCDDLGTPEGLLISPETFRDCFLPWYRNLFDLCHAHGAFVHMHSHGNIAAVLPMLVEAGVDILNPFDPRENPHLEELIERFGDRVVFCGFSRSDYYLLPEDEVEAMFARMAELGRKCRRGYVIMEHGFPEELSPRKFRFILDLIEKYRRID